MDKEKSRRKEAERTLERIKGTLNHLEDGSAFKDPLENQEFQRMKSLIESGYSHSHPSLFKRLLILLRHPIFLALFILLFAMLIYWFQH